MSDQNRPWMRAVTPDEAVLWLQPRFILHLFGEIVKADFLIPAENGLALFPVVARAS